MKTEALAKLVSAHRDGREDEFSKIVREEIDEERRRGQLDKAARLEAALAGRSSASRGTAQAQGLLMAPFEQPVGGRPGPAPVFPPPATGGAIVPWVLEEPRATLKDIVVEEGLEKRLRRISSELGQEGKLRSWGIHDVLRAVFRGPPGTGKTLAARAVAGEAKRPLLTVRLDAVLSSYLGETARNLNAAFEEAVARNAILFLDEVDALAKQRDDPHELGEMKRVVNALLQDMDRTVHTLPIIAATNHDQLLDHAMWRRFTDVLDFRPPNEEARGRILRIHLRHVPHAQDVRAEDLAAKTVGRTGADLVILVRNAVRHAVSEGQERVRIDDFAAALDELQSNTGSMGRAVVSEEMQKILALASEGFNQREIGQRLGISAATVNRRLRSVHEPG